jgi:hypothetical protein
VTRSPTGLAVLLAAGALTLASCGGSEPTRPAPGTPGNPLVAGVSEPSVDVADATGQGTAKRGDHAAKAMPNGGSSPHIARSRGGSSAGVSQSGGEPSARVAPSGDKPAYQKLLDRQTRHPANRFTPCNLVTESQARGILGRPVQQPVEAPQGPTCIYRPQSGKRLIALAVQQLDFDKVKPLLRKPRAITVADHTGFCGTYGQAMLFVPLSRLRVLTVSAPCTVAKAFATQALPHL